MKRIILIISGIILLSSTFFSCKSDDEEEPKTGTLKGIVTDNSTGKSLADVRIIVYSSETNAPIGSTIVTSSDGKYSVQLDPGVYYLKLGKQGYLDIPANGATPVSVTVEVGKTAVNDYQMQASAITNGGTIIGKVTSDGKALPGVLVIASGISGGYSSASGSDGMYYIYNVPAGSYAVKGYMSKYNSTEVSVNVAASTEAKNNNIVLTVGANGSVSGTVTFLATNNGNVDVTLVDIITKESIPGLSTVTIDGNYSINDIPNGKYVAKASFKNDNYVVDPDWLIKNGDPVVDIQNNSISLNFSVTGAVKIVSPTNDSATIKPFEVTGNPVFTWTAYSSVSDYIIEVSDINGNVVWGGFTSNNGAITKNISIPKSAVTINYNSDGKAQALKTGTTYRWRIFASKDDAKEPNGWKLISVSEEQRGLFVIK